MQAAIGVIGGSGLSSLACLEGQHQQVVSTPFGLVNTLLGQVDNKPVVFIPRHGLDHNVPPHKVNYRANLWALKACSVTQIFAFNVVGGISERMHPGNFVLADQLIDYTWGREHTYHDGNHYSDLPELAYADMTQPIIMHSKLYKQVFTSLQLPYVMGAVYGCTQGPRLETPVEISRLAKDGCDVVGMTAMPEAALARELSLNYSMISYVVNWAAGVNNNNPCFEEIMEEVHKGAQKANEVFPLIIKIMNN